MTTALYRRYRPETFAEVVGQDHVTGPLRQALRSGQINHAYLFSGPRGCGKTTSARILARCLNCAEGPTDTPCGVCESCVELARGGPGSLDVVEIDAASHGGVDDARDLRERATFAPARDRYKIFILDEAHMVSPQGFNALLKIVEEPPEHVKFIFATTEPDKVIGTIRSRTHHYPFRLVPPEVMTDYLGQICGTEGIAVGSGVLPLVVRAGGGSVRDSLSVLDQLIAGSGPQGLVYEDAVALLGYTHASLLDDLVAAIAARDGASAFRVVERVVSTGHEPRRFVEDLLERLRDLIVLQASGEAADAVLRDIPGDQLARMRTQAQHLGAAELSRSADLANAALTEMSGATSPRLHLELLMARLLLPAMDDSTAGLGARLDRLERTGVAAAPAGPTGPQPVTPVERVAVIAGPSDESTPGQNGAQAAASGAALARAAMAAGRAADAGAGTTPPSAVPVGAPITVPDAARVEPAESTAAEHADPAPAEAEHRPEPVTERVEPEGWADTPAGETPSVHDSARATEPQGASVRDATEIPESTPTIEDVPAPQPVPVSAPTPESGSAPAAQDTEMLRRRWPEVLETLAGLKKATWVLVSQNAQVIELNSTTLTLGFNAPGLATAFRGGQHGELVHQAVRETLGFDVRVEGALAGDHTPPAPSPAPSGRPATPEAPAADQRETRPAGSAREHQADPASGPGRTEEDEAPADPWAHATPAEGTAVPAQGADAMTDRAPADDSASAGPVEWPEVAPIPGSANDSNTAPGAGSVGTAGAAAEGAGPATDATGSPDGADRTGGVGQVDAAGWAVPAEGPESTATPAGTDSSPAGSDRPVSRPALRPADEPPLAEPSLDEPPLGDEPPPWDDDPGPAEPPEDPWAEGPAARSTGAPAPARSAPEAPRRPAPSQAPSAPLSGADRVRAAMARGDSVTVTPDRSATPNWADDEPSMDDPDITASGMVGVQLVAQALGGVVIEEQIDDQPGV